MSRYSRSGPNHPLIRLAHPRLVFAQDERLAPTAALIAEVVRRIRPVGNAPRFALCVGALPLARSLVGGSAAPAAIADLRRTLVDLTYAVLFRRHQRAVNPLGLQLTPIEYEIDGLGVNHRFMGDELDFRSTRQLHFDIVEPISSNLYLPTVNVRGGFPVFADLRGLCTDRGVEIRKVLEKIPGTRNLTVARDYYVELVTDYAVAFELDTESDMPFSIIFNHVENGGVLHGATDVSLRHPTESGERRLIHYALDDTSIEAADAWYRSLGMDPGRAAGDPAAEKPFHAGFGLDVQPDYYPV